jgi:C1A family cysteine protease
VAYGAVSPIKNQGSCTATYAFSAVGAIEGVSVIFFKNQQEYSVQQVIDCSQGFGNNGCYNGRMDNTFNYVKAVGINTWAAYPYIGYLQSCRVSSGFFRVNGSIAISDCNSLSNALMIRPISVAVDGQNFQSYRNGIFKNCGTNLSLAVLLVGMTDTYWTLKNSWGQSWGENGYIRIARGNTCGICQAASYPIV